MQGDGSGRMPPAELTDGALWRRSQATETAVADAERYLDMAAFADGRLDPDDAERMAAWTAADADMAADVVAARALAGDASHPAADAIVERAAALVGGGAKSARIIPFPQPVRPPGGFAGGFGGVARWASLAAAMMVAGWLGFTLGVDTSHSLAGSGQGDDGFLHELFDPSTGVLRDLTEDAQT